MISYLDEVENMSNDINVEGTIEMPNIDATVSDLMVEQWLQVRKDSALLIDAETAEVTWWHAKTLDPYGVYPDDPPECQQIGRAYFARSPGGDMWVSFYDLSDEAREKLWKRMELMEGMNDFDDIDWLIEL